ncbi:ABC transporter permease [Schlesneria sp. T3-172]|uniref:ABC transporter permease n=1 Tax=Schlesneria sphaerica TaxID=3373610 RepID=UPI0037CA29FF
MRTLSSSLRVKWCILRTSIEERLVYRGDFAFATLVRFLPIVTQVFLWGAIYQASGPKDPRIINGYTYGDMVAYSLLVMVGRAFSSMPGLTTGLARDIREGSIKKFLIQPIDLLEYLFWHRVAHKLVYYAVAFLPFAFVFWLCRDYLHGWPDAPMLLGWIVSLLIAFAVGFLIESLMGLIAFWFLEVSSLVFVYMLLSYLLSGHMLPLDWLPAPYSDAIQLLPFKYLAFVPAAILLEKYSHQQLWLELGNGILWIIALWGINRLALAKGVRRYSAFGG